MVNRALEWPTQWETNTWQSITLLIEQLNTGMRLLLDGTGAATQGMATKVPRSWTGHLPPAKLRWLPTDWRLRMTTAAKSSPTSEHKRCQHPPSGRMARWSWLLTQSMFTEAIGTHSLSPTRATRPIWGQSPRKNICQVTLLRPLQMRTTVIDALLVQH